MNTPVVCRAPGKLLVAGEYAVLTPGQPAIVAAVDRHITVTASSTRHADVELVTDLTARPYALHRRDGTLVPARAGARPDALTHLLAVVRTVERLRVESGLPEAPVRLDVRSRLHEKGVKIGLGSSGAVTVAAVQALTAFTGIELTPELRLRLALLVTATVDPQASGSDVAASTLGGWVLYTPPDRGELLRSLRTEGVAATLSGRFTGLTLEALAPPATPLQVGWTGRPASTPAKVGHLRRTAWWDSAAHHGFLRRSAELVHGLALALSRGDQEAAIHGVGTASALLSDLDQRTECGIFTPALTRLCETARAVGGAGKPSGAGGGDCGIALLPSASAAAALRQRWSAVGIVPLRLGTAEAAALPGEAPGRPPAEAPPSPTGETGPNRRSPR
ncbi:phosphomevalonate kinase [Kitasatospora sp. NPDC001664]